MEAGPGLSPEPSSFLPITWCLGPTGEGRVLEMGLHGYGEQVHRVQLFHNRHWHQPDPGKRLACSRAGDMGACLGELSLKGLLLCRLSGTQNQGCEGKFHTGRQHTLKAITLPHHSSCLLEKEARQARPAAHCLGHEAGSPRTKVKVP